MMLRAALVFGFVLGGCAGPRHLNARTGEAFAAVVARQERIDDEATTVELTGEEVPRILAGLQAKSEDAAAGSRRSSGLALMPLAR